MPKLFGKRSKPPALAAGRVFEVTSSEIGGSSPPAAIPCRDRPPGCRGEGVPQASRGA